MQGEINGQFPRFEPSQFEAHSHATREQARQTEKRIQECQQQIRYHLNDGDKIYGLQQPYRGREVGRVLRVFAVSRATNDLVDLTMYIATVTDLRLVSLGMFLPGHGFGATSKIVDYLKAECGLKFKGEDLPATFG